MQCWLTQLLLTSPVGGGRWRVPYLGFHKEGAQSLVDFTSTSLYSLIPTQAGTSLILSAWWPHPIPSKQICCSPLEVDSTPCAVPQASVWWLLLFMFAQSFQALEADWALGQWIKVSASHYSSWSHGSYELYELGILTVRWRSLIPYLRKVISFISIVLALLFRTDQPLSALLFWEIFRSFCFF